MNLYIIEIESLKAHLKGGRKLAVHAENEETARDLVQRRYDRHNWIVRSVNERTGPAAITFEENWWE